MPSHLKRSIGISLVLLLLVAVDHQISAKSDITNDITIESNTGGNQVSNQKTNNLKTGSSTTNISITNQTNTSPNPPSNDTSTTKIDIKTSGEGTNTVKINTVKQKFELFQKDGQTIIKTTNDLGETQERQLQGREELHLMLNDRDIRISPSGTDFVIHDTKTNTYTTSPLTIDAQTRKIFLMSQGTSLELKTLPITIHQAIGKQKFLDELKDVIRIHVDNNHLYYQTKGIKTKKFLRLFPTTVNFTLRFDADTGNVVEQKPTSTFDQVKNILST